MSLINKSLIRLNAESDPSYRPYCLRCKGIQRMEIVAQFAWKCPICGAIHDERTLTEVAIQSNIK